jgi:hypothetical protein
VISVALDKDFDAARPWIEAASPTHPSLVDTHHVVSDLYNMVNVPTILWIDEAGRIVRPNDVAFGNNKYRELTGLDADVHKQALREWVRGEKPAIAPDRTRALQTLPTEPHQEARAEFALARWLWEQGRSDAAEPHFVRAGELAPDDFNIRRGSMPMRDIDPMGPTFFKMSQEWAEAGNKYYLPLTDA